MSRNAILIGATGLVGRTLLNKLVKQFDTLYLPVRKQFDCDEPNIVFLSFDQAKDLEVDSFFNCLGTTIKKAKSKENFERIDKGIPLQILNDNPRIENVYNISSLGASKDSTHFYLKTKGSLEEEINQLGKKLVIHYHPSILDGDREESRPLEYVGIKAARVLNFLPVFKKYAPTKVEDLAAIVTKDAASELVGVITRESIEISKISS